jgi:transcription antitermination factor NusG
MAIDRAFPSGDFLPGDKVRIVDGIFTGMEGRILSDDEVRRRGLWPPPPSHARLLFWLLPTISGQDVPVQMEPSQFPHA